MKKYECDVTSGDLPNFSGSATTCMDNRNVFTGPVFCSTEASRNNPNCPPRRKDAGGGGLQHKERHFEIITIGQGIAADKRSVNQNFRNSGRHDRYSIASESCCVGHPPAYFMRSSPLSPQACMKDLGFILSDVADVVIGLGLFPNRLGRAGIGTPIRQRRTAVIAGTERRRLVGIRYEFAGSAAACAFGAWWPGWRKEHIESDLTSVS
jgi:hypothetical protein